MVLAKRTKRREEELTDRSSIAPALKRAADDILEPRVFKMGKFESDTVIAIDDKHDIQDPIFPSSVAPNSNISKIAASYLTLPPELRQPILHHAIDNDIVLFKHYSHNLG
ncbi:hypothetical protein BLS_001512 [Venturia inaequalis]|uniref:Uncharacterized protein n=1 Tax=Venturia inaequalis TaxID=5025 RepID=A0A8H3U1U4_VENIN|nr:hypothetical protein BLS_001512 [Venturia inaequalis]